MSIGSFLTLGTIGLGSKALLNTICSGVSINGLQHLLTALDEANRKDGGIITSKLFAISACSTGL